MQIAQQETELRELGDGLGGVGVGIRSLMQHGRQTWADGIRRVGVNELHGASLHAEIDASSKQVLEQLIAT